jgi:putative heme iron utilization protein
MDAETQARLARLVRESRVAALGTLRGGAPLVSLVLYLPEEDFSAFVLHVSRLAWHTQDMERDARVSLSIAEADDGRADPQTLMRVSLRGAVERVASDGGETARLEARWLARYPESAQTFQLADFAFWRLTPADARFVAGFGRTHNLAPQDLREAAQRPPI